MTKALLSIENLKAEYATEEGVVRAVDGLDLTVGRGETVGLIGESGCGKTTTVLSIMRLLGNGGRIVGGSIEFNGTDLLALSEAAMRRLRGREIAAVFQDVGSALNPVLTVGEQIVEGVCAQLGLRRRAAWRYAGELMAAVGMPEAAKRLRDYPHQFSGGMRQRAMIAMAVAGRPALLLADEPTAAVDAPVQMQILDLIAELKRQFDMTVLLVTHDLGVAAAVCDRVAVMHSGRIVERGDVEAILANPQHPHTQQVLAAARSLHGAGREVACE